MKQNKLRRKAASKKAVFCGGIRGFVVILLAGLFILTGLKFSEYREASFSEASLSGIRELAMINNETEIAQEFRARFSDLDCIYVYFANEHEGKNQGLIHFTIFDEEGEAVASASVDANEIVNKGFTKVELSMKLVPLAKYKLMVGGSGLISGKAPILYRERNSIGGNGAVLEGTRFVGKMEARFYYPAETFLQMAGIMALTVLLMGIVLWQGKEAEEGERPGRGIPRLAQALRLKAGCTLPCLKKEIPLGRCLEEAMFLAAPLLSFYIVEHFTYNSIWDIYPLGTALNLAIYYCLYFLGYAVTNSRRANVVGCLALGYFLGAANYFVLSFRGTPILPTDMASLTTAMNVAANYTYSLNSAFFTNALLALFFGILFCKLKKGRKMAPRTRTAVLGGVMALGLATAALIGQEKLLAKGNVKADIWNQKRGYSRDGALASFFLNAKYLYAEKPEGYSVDKVKEIAETYIWNEEETASLNGMSGRTKARTSAKKEQDEKSGQSSQKNPNIIMIMNEAFSDLQVIGSIPTNKDYMPFIHRLEKNTIKGNLFVSIFGAGTCNSEFEVLTGNSMAFLPSGSIGYTQFVKDAMPNLVQTLKAQGYTGNIAVHPYLADGWNRTTVYPLFGFEDFLSQDDFEDPEMVRKYISDEEDFQKMISLYEENKKEHPDDPCFLFTVTMQNHGGFSQDYGNLDKEIEITDPVLKDEEAEQYLSLIRKSDDAFKKLVKYFKKQDDPTLIVMWGDHQPSIHDEFYQKLYGKDMDSLTVEELQKKYQVPFIIWANYDIQEREVEALSANYLGSYLLQVAGLQMTPYQRYLLDLSKKLPVINAVGYIGEDGKYYEQGEKSEYSDYISNYKILQYNNVIDYKNRYDSFFGSGNLVD